MICRTAPPVAVLAICAFFAFHSNISAQSTATLTGTVMDQSGAVIPGAGVLCRNTATQLELRTVTNSGGLFRIPNIPVGTYTVTVSRAGFGTLVRSGIELLTDHTVDLSLALQVGAASQSVSVTAAAPLVQSTTSDVQTTVNSRQMAELPLNGRNAFQLAVLTPGATDTDAGTMPGQSENAGLAVNGMRPTDNNWALDGGSYTNAQTGGTPTLPNPDTLQEFTALTSNFSAENRGGGAVIKLTTRSGTNQYHGTLFEFLRNDAMDARNFFGIGPEPYKQNQYGGTIGGPIRKNRLFYFGSFQGTNKRGSPSPRTTTVPTAAQHEGVFTKTIMDPTSGMPFPNNTIPRSRWDSIGTKLLAYVPLPNSGANRLLFSPPSNKNDYQYTIKLDYVLGDKDHLSGRYFSDRNSYQRDNASVPGFYGNSIFRNQTVLVSESHTFSPTWVMEQSFNYLRTFREETPVTAITMQELGAQVKPSLADVPRKISVTLSGYTQVTTARGIHFNPALTEYRGGVSHPVNNHFVRFGGTFRHNHNYNLNLGNELGSWTFNVQRTNSTAIRNSGDAIAGLLLGLPSNFSQNVTKAYVFTNTLFGLWIQDDWKVTRRLTLNLGVREDPWMAPKVADGVLVGFVPGMRSKIAPNAPVGMVFSGDPGIPDSILHNYFNQLAPRAGFAWDVTGNGNTIVRGGYGIYRMSSEVFSLLRAWAGASPGNNASVSISSPPSTANPYAGYTGTVPFPYTPPKKSDLAHWVFPAYANLNAFDPSTKPGYTQSWNLTVERQITTDTALSVAYVGNHSLRAMSAIKGNAAIYAPGATTDNANMNSRRPYQGIGSINLANAYNHGSYNALQAGLTKRPGKGLILQSSYTFSKALDLNSSSMLGGALGQTPRNPYNANLDKGPADFDTTHHFKASALYDVPGLTSARGFVGALLNGWQLNGIVSARSGFALTCRSGVDNSFSGLNADTCDQVLEDIRRPAGADPLKMWFNTAAFASNQVGTFGTAGRNILRRPGAFNLDIGVLKHVRLRERLLAELRAEAFNAFNHANFDLFYNPTTYKAETDFTSASFGQISYARDPRLMQVSLKLKF